MGLPNVGEKAPEFSLPVSRDAKVSLGDYAGKVWRIGCMGHTARQRNVTLLLGALAEIMEG